METAHGIVAGDRKRRDGSSRAAVDDWKLLIHISREAERIAQADSVKGLRTAVRKSYIRRTDVQNSGRTQHVSCAGEALCGCEIFRRVGIVRINPIAEWREGQAL